MLKSCTVRQIAITAGHELNHFNHYVTGNYQKWRRTGSDRSALWYSEYLAYKWEVHWGGNINYAAPHTPSWYMNDFRRKSSPLVNKFGK